MVPGLGRLTLGLKMAQVISEVDNRRRPRKQMHWIQREGAPIPMGGLGMASCRRC